MKLQSQKKKNMTIAIIALAVIAVVVIVGLVISILVSQHSHNHNNSSTGSEINKIMISSTSNKIEYYVGEKFDPTGASIQVLTKDMEYTYFVDYTQLEFSGFDSSVANDAVTITVTYKGFTASYTIKIKEMPSSDSSSTNPDVVKVEVCNMFTTYTLDQWNNYGPSDLGAYVKLTYADGTVRGSLEETHITRGDMWDYQSMDAPGTTYITVKYVENGETYETTVKITVTN